MSDPAELFRWQAVFGRSTDALFLLDRQRRLRFVNKSWEQLTGLASAEVRMLSCKRRRPALPGDDRATVLTHVLRPPLEAMEGETRRVRRRLPTADGRGSSWWDVEFFPLRGPDGLVGIHGKISPVPVAATAQPAPVPERLGELRERCVARFDVQILDGETAGLSRLSAQVRLACQLRQPVLLVGEQGVGKETIARLIHNRSADREGPFVAIDCGRLTPGLLAETLFGDRGVAAPAAPSTVYLRTLERLPCDLQSRLCEQITSDGGGQPRYLAGCTSSPDALVKSGGLVSELYDALGVLVLEVPALRERRPDWPLLVSRLLARGAEEGGARPTSLTPAAWDVMRTHDWPGNLTELYAVLQSARRHAKGSAIDVDDLPASLRLKSRLASTPDAGAASPLSLPLDQILERTERRLIELALRRTGGHRTRAADVLGVYRYRLARRIEALGLGTPDKTDVDDADKA